MDILNDLINYKQKNNLTNVALAKKINFCVHTTSDLVNRKTNPAYRTKVMLFKFLHGVSVNDNRIFKTHGAAVKYYRVMLNLTQKKLGELAGFVKGSRLIDELERGRHKTSKKTILTLEKLLNRQIVVRTYLPCTSRLNIMKNILEKHYLSRYEVARRAGQSIKKCPEALNNINNVSIYRLKGLCKGLGVHHSIFIDFNLAKKYFT